MKKMTDFYENLNALEHFRKHFHFLDEQKINFYDRIYAKLFQKDKNKKYLKIQKYDTYF